jgi:hypothetical protein
VFPGNTGDPAAFTAIVQVVRDKFGLAHRAHQRTAPGLNLIGTRSRSPWRSQNTTSPNPHSQIAMSFQIAVLAYSGGTRTK